ncbi:MAG: M15 family metallopeptidase [bacterium]|nr:M15 family metallopeptidase [bacterium]
MNNIRTIKTAAFLTVFFLLHPGTGHSAEKKETVIADFEKGLIEQGLVDVQTLNPDIRVDLKYSTTDNFLGVDMYGSLTKCYLVKEAARKLARAQTCLTKIKPGYRLLVFDGLRPRRYQYKMWDVVKGTARQRYVANPRYGSIHNYGAAVDLSIADAAGKELDMGTPFDSFSKRAQPRYEQVYLKKGKLTKKQIENRELLRAVMKQAGFHGLRIEWWHFNAFPKSVIKKKYKIIE